MYTGPPVFRTTIVCLFTRLTARINWPSTTARLRLGQVVALRFVVADKDDRVLGVAGGGHRLLDRAGAVGNRARLVAGRVRDLDARFRPAPGCRRAE